MRQWRVVCGCLLAAACLATAGCGTGTVQLYRTRSKRDLVTVHRLDPKIFADDEKSIGLSFDIGLPGGVTVSPGVKFAQRSKMEWNDCTNRMIKQYLKLVEDHNNAKITLEDYWDRRRKLDDLFVSLAFSQPVTSFRMKQVEEWEKIADTAQDELDAELAKLHGEDTPAAAKVDSEKLKKDARKEATRNKKQIASELASLQVRLKALEADAAAP